jgi:FixJ family two-component response regulator
VNKLKHSSNSKSAVHVVDDDEAMRLSMDSLFRSVGYEVQLFSNAVDFLNSGRAAAPGCLILDVRLPGMNGLDFQNHLIGAGHCMPIVFVTGHGDIPMTVRGMKAGAVDFLAKPFREQDMLDAVASALELDADQRAQRDGVKELKDRCGLLTSREHQVMAEVARGQMNKQIAYVLGLSEITVKIHRSNAMRKLGTRNITELIMFSETLKRQPVLGDLEGTFVTMAAAG